MSMRTVLAVSVAAAGMLLVAPQGASALPELSGAKQLNKPTVEQAGHRRWRRGHYHHHHHYGYYDRYYYRRRPGFGIYLGF